MSEAARGRAAQGRITVEQIPTAAQGKEQFTSQGGMVDETSAEQKANIAAENVVGSAMEGRAASRAELRGSGVRPLRRAGS